MAVVVIPAYQPDKTLVEIADGLWTLGYGMIVVDDGSGKEYQHIFDSISDIAIILHHSANRGKGAAIKTALAYIKKEMWDNDVIGVMDADGQHRVEDMRKVIDHAKLHRNTLVLGTRMVGEKMPVRSRIGNWLTRSIFHLASGVKLSDTQTGLRAFGLELVGRLLFVDGERYEYEMNVLFMAVKEKIPLEEVPVDTIYHDKENSCSHFRVFKDSIRIYRDILKFMLSSASSFVIDYVLFTVFMFLLPHTAGCILAANVLARAVSAFYNYSMNCHFVFGTERKAKTALGYFALAAGILMTNNLILELYVEFGHFSVYMAKILTECTLFCISFMVQKKLIFKKYSQTAVHHSSLSKEGDGMSI